MAITLSTYATGDTGYIAKLNSDNGQIQSALNALIATSGGASVAISFTDFLNGLFGGTVTIIGIGSYAESTASTNMTIAAGVAYTPSDSQVVQSLAPVVLAFSGQAAATYYVNLDAAGNPSISATAGDALYSVVWTGTAFGTITVLYNTYVTGGVTNTSGALTANLPVFGNAGNDLKVGTKRGNTTVVQMASNATAPTAGNLARYDGNGNTQDGGSLGGVQAKTANYTALAGDSGTLLTFASGSAITLLLPAAPPSATWFIEVENTGAGTLTVSPNSLNLDGAGSSLSLTTNTGVKIYTDGTNYFTQRGAAASSGGSFADNETPTGALNGSNQTFTLAHTPNPAGSLILVINGVVQLSGTDFTLSSGTVTLLNATPNSSNGEWIRAWYRY